MISMISMNSENKGYSRANVDIRLRDPPAATATKFDKTRHLSTFLDISRHISTFLNGHICRSHQKFQNSTFLDASRNVEDTEVRNFKNSKKFLHISQHFSIRRSTKNVEVAAIFHSCRTIKLCCRGRGYKGLSPNFARSSFFRSFFYF